MAFYFQKPYDPAIEHQLRQYYQSLSERTAAALRQLKQSNWDMAASGTSRRSLDAILTPCGKGCESSSNSPMIPLVM